MEYSGYLKAIVFVLGLILLDIESNNILWNHFVKNVNIFFSSMTLQVEPFIQWLEEAEEESDSDDE